MSTPEEKIEVDEEKKDYIVSGVEEYCKSRGYKYLNIDGVKVLYDDGFALVRKSNTGPHLTTRYEAKNIKELNKRKEEFNNLINKLKEE